MRVPLLDLKAQYQSIKSEIRPCIDEICESQYFILGPHVDEMEAKLAAYCNVRYAVGVSSGTDALLIALMAAGIGPGDRVITSPYTFFSTAGAIARLGAVPVFVDIEPTTYNIDVHGLVKTLEQMDAGRRDTVKAVIPVHLYGQCAEMGPLMDISRRYRLTVIEDAAQAIGAEYQDQRAGSMGDLGCFSFFPSKNLGAFGDAGLVTAQSKALNDRLRMLRVHGMEPKYYHQIIGGNFRIDALQAAVVAIKLDHLDDWTSGRRQNAATYRRLIQAAGLEDRVILPAEVQSRHIYNQFVVRVSGRRDALKDFLGQQGIGTEVYYPVPLHLQACFADLGYGRGDFPEAERAAEETLALPIYPELTQDQLSYVVASIKAFFDR